MPMGSSLAVVVTNPSILPWFHSRWDAFQVWLTAKEGLIGTEKW